MGRRVTPEFTLVLGAGGPVGWAYHAGVLRALEEALGWDAREAAHVIGTSAGAQVGALLRAGVGVCDLYAYAVGAEMSPAGLAIAKHLPRPALLIPPPDERVPGPASIAYVRH